VSRAAVRCLFYSIRFVSFLCALGLCGSDIFMLKGLMAVVSSNMGPIVDDIFIYSS
jgi:hypothetical protein